MVVLVQLDDDVLPAHSPRDEGRVTATAATSDGPPADERPNPNINGFSAALSCYPIVRQLAGQLDLNTLHNLSRTCRQFRANLLEYRDQLIKHTLHCDFDSPLADERLAARHHSLNSIQQMRPMTNGRFAKCARDMVAECKRCAVVVCRNCTIKPPPPPTLRARHRRLCRTCSRAPLHLLMAGDSPRSTAGGTPTPPASPDVRPTLYIHDAQRAFTSSAFERTPCDCDNIVWLCYMCGQQLRNADTLYLRAWTWRTRYCHYLGGVGTGVGEGNEGVECGRQAACLAAKIVEHEVDCDSETLAILEGASASPDRWTGTSYHAQEIEGVGGVFKMKAKKQVRVGECVKIYEDERDRSIQFLEREVAGKLRSWCSWCNRVILSKRDVAELAGERPPSSASSSVSSTK